MSLKPGDKNILQPAGRTARPVVVFRYDALSKLCAVNGVHKITLGVNGSL